MKTFTYSFILLITIFTNFLFSQTYRTFIDVSYQNDSIFITEKKDLDEDDKIFNKIKDSLYSKAFEVDKTPIYKGCERIYSRQARFICMQNRIFKSIYVNLEYPKESILKNEQSSVIVNYFVDVDGKVYPYELVYYSKILKNATFDAIKKWLYQIKDYQITPAYLDEKPVKYSDFMIFTFVMTAKYPAVKNQKTNKKKTKK